MLDDGSFEEAIKKIKVQKQQTGSLKKDTLSQYA
jgi:hypothetical protein